MTISLPRRVAENIDRFSGRVWLLPQLLEWWEGSYDRLFLLTGGPGTGKSMILAWLAGFGPQPEEAVARKQFAALRAAVKAAHFCQAASRNIAPQAFTENIANQLTRTVKGYGDALAATLADRVQIIADIHVGNAERSTVTGNAIGRIDLAGLGDEFSFDQAFTRPLKQLYAAGHTEPILLLVDALDEAFGYTGDKTVPELLASLDDLPAAARILATTRYDPRVLSLFDSIEPFDLIHKAPPNVDDVRDYVRQRLVQSAALGEAKQVAFAQRLATRAKGVFLYAAIVLDEVLPQLPEIPDLAAYPLPDGLSGLYKRFLRRELGKERAGKAWPWLEIYEPLLGMISVAQGEGLTTTQLTAIIGKDIRDALRASKQYLIGELPDGPFKPFHKSFADFLLEDEDNVDYHIDARSMHRRIARYLWETYHADWQRCDDYGLNNLASHLFLSQELDRLRKLISRAWMNVRYMRSNYNYAPFYKDVELDMFSASTQQPPKWVQLVRDAMLCVSLREHSSNVPPVLVAALAIAGHYDQALDHASLIQDWKKRAHTYFLIAKVLLGEGYSEQARYSLTESLTAAKLISEWLDKESAVADIARGLAEAGEYQEAIAQAETLNDGWEKSTIYKTIVSKLTESGYADKALDVISSYRDSGGHRDEGLYGALARGLAMAGNFTRAQAFVEQVNEPYSKIDLLVELSHLLHTAGQTAQAFEVLVSCSEILKEIPDLFRRDSYGKLAGAYARIGFLDSISKLLNEIDDSWNREQTIIAVLKELISRNEFPRVFEIIEKFGGIVDDYSYHDSLIRLVTDAEKFDEAFRMIELRRGSTWNTIWKAVVSITQAAKLSWRGQDEQIEKFVENAIESAGQFFDGEIKVRLISNAASCLMALGEVTRATQLAIQSLRVVRKMEDGQGKASATEFAIEALVLVGEYDKVFELYNELDTEQCRERALSAVVKTLFRLGRRRNVLELLAHANSMSVRMGPTHGTISAYGRFVTSLVNLGANEQAKAVAMHLLDLTKSQDREINSSVLNYVATALANVGLFDQALEIASRLDSFEDFLIKGSTLGNIAVSLAVNQEIERALDVCEMAAIPGKDRGLYAVAALLAHQRDWARATSIAAAIWDDFDKCGALAIIALESIKANEFERAVGFARQLDDQIEDKDAKSHWLHKVANMMREQGEHGKALQIEGMVPLEEVQTRKEMWPLNPSANTREFEALLESSSDEDKQARRELLLKILQIMIESGDLVAALKVAQGLRESTVRTAALARVADEAKSVDDQTILSEALEDLKPPGRVIVGGEDNVLMDAALDFVVANQADRAILVVKAIDDVRTRGKTIQSLAPHCSRKVDLDKLSVIAKGVEDAAVSAKALVSVGQGYARIGMDGQARKNICSAIVSASRTTRDNVFNVLEGSADILAAVDQGITLFEIFVTLRSADA